MNVNILADRVRSFIGAQVTKMSMDSPVMAFMKPLVIRVLDNNVYKIEEGLKLIADKEGNIEVESLLTEMIDSVSQSRPFVINTSFIGDIEIGDGLIKMNLPVVNKRLAFNMSDLQELKELLTK